MHLTRVRFGKLPLQTFFGHREIWHISRMHTPAHWLGFTRTSGGDLYPETRNDQNKDFPKMNTKHQTATTAILIYLNFVTRFGLSSRLRITDSYFNFDKLQIAWVFPFANHKHKSRTLAETQANKHKMLSVKRVTMNCSHPFRTCG